jgi:hypothetical protein
MSHRPEGAEQRRKVMPGQIGHKLTELVIGAPADQLADGTIVAEVFEETLPPGAAALEDQRRVILVWTGIDPVSQRLAARLRKGLLKQRTVFQDDDVPAHRAEYLAETFIEPLLYDRIKALAVVVDHPPGVPELVLPAFEQRLEDVAFVELGVADQGDHPPFGL